MILNSDGGGGKPALPSAVLLLLLAPVRRCGVQATVDVSPTATAVDIHAAVGTVRSHCWCCRWRRWWWCSGCVWRAMVALLLLLLGWRGRGRVVMLMMMMERRGWWWQWHRHDRPRYTGRLPESCWAAGVSSHRGLTTAAPSVEEGVHRLTVVAAEARAHGAATAADDGNVEGAGADDDHVTAAAAGCCSCCCGGGHGDCRTPRRLLLLVVVVVVMVSARRRAVHVAGRRGNIIDAVVVRYVLAVADVMAAAHVACDTAVP